MQFDARDLEERSGSKLRRGSKLEAGESGDTGSEVSLLQSGCRIGCGACIGLFHCEN